MEHYHLKHWHSALNRSNANPAYLLIADLISADIESGALKARDKLLPLRELASFLSLDYTTVARAYKEAKNRGLIDSRPGIGTFIKGSTQTLSSRDSNHIEMTMNLPPEPQDSQLLNKLTKTMQGALTQVDTYTQFRYQDFGGTLADKNAGLFLLKDIIENPNPEYMLVCPGIHSALVALMSLLVKPGEAVCVQSLIYPGLKAIAAQLNITLYAVESDTNGPIIHNMEALLKTNKIAAIYLNPTIHNPTAHTINLSRREAIADLALRFSIPIIEDDAYGMLPESPVPAIANLAPELTYYITGLAKCFGAGLRVGYLYTPNKQLAQRVTGTLRALSVMASPVTNNLATQCILDGSVSLMITHIREECRYRLLLAAEYLAGLKYFAHPQGFHIWIELPNSFHESASELAKYLRSKKISAVASAAFCADNNPPNAIRMCFGGSMTRLQCKEAFLLIASTLEK